MTEVKIINQSGNALPAFATASSAGMDLMAWLTEPLTIAPGAHAMVPTGLFMALPEGYEAQVRPRSGLAAKHRVTVLNAPGTIDADYRGEIKVILINHGETDFTIQSGDRIAQMVIAKYERVTFVETESLEQTDRGAGGFGHTGK